MGKTISLWEEKLKIEREREAQRNGCNTQENCHEWMPPDFLREPVAPTPVAPVGVQAGPKKVVPRSRQQAAPPVAERARNCIQADRNAPCPPTPVGRREPSVLQEPVTKAAQPLSTRKRYLVRRLGDNQRLQADPEPVTFEEKEDRVKTAVPEMDAGEETTGGQVSAKELEEAGDELYYPSVAEEYPEKVLAEARKKKDEVKDELARRIAADKKADKLKVLAEVIDEVKLTREEKRALYKEISREITGYGVLEPYMEDPKVTELMINNHQSAFVKVDGIIRRIPLKFDSPKALYDYIQNLIQPIGRPLDETNTNLNGQLPDGTRLNATCPPQSRECTLNLRKPPGRTARFTVDDYVKSGAATREIMDFLGYYHNRRANMLILGATDTGKTTFIRIMIENYSSPRERWIMLEDTLELNCHHPHFLAFQQVQRGADESEWFTLAQIFDRTVLRKAPDRIGVGEILRNEATALVRGVSAGHDGFIGSMHAGSPHKTIFLLVTKLKEAGMDIDEEYLRRMLHECIDFMIFLKRSSRTGRRVIWQVWEVLSLDEAAELGVKPFNLLYKFNPRTGKFEKVNELASEEKKEKFGTPEEVVEW